MSSELLYNFFSDDDFLRISNKISEMEKFTAGEIRVAVKEEKQFLKKNKSLRELAEEEFHNLKMDETRDKTGILLYLILQERQFYILADSGINEKVKQETWDKIRDEMQNEFREGHFANGMLLGIEKVGKILLDHFPIKEDDTNELSNKVVF
ncbi:MAG: TPM domain-containing protein [Bacteroidetes bacterium]|nr:TPM domain-containing protein [Bacteroidota bacterium]